MPPRDQLLTTADELSLAGATDILLVEDEPSFRELLENFLACAGYAVRAVGSGRAALTFLGAQRCRLLLTDIFMPDSDGLELLTQLRRSHPGLPIIAMSGSGNEILELNLKIAQHLGAQRALAKPFALAELLTAVRAAIGQPA